MVQDRAMSMDMFQALVVALVVTRLDYGNAVLTGLPVYLSRRLQSVLNAAAYDAQTMCPTR